MSKQTWKIVGKDNFDRETVSDWLAAADIPSEALAKVMCKALNQEYCADDNAPTHYVVKPSDYKLYKFEP